ncbi:MAG: GNAT family N-acetyltransferase [Candidatus Margulisbacteria bacterium]|nr:GNAT family N-acetyltransferase [Candidatus Margulisiibacteriota bacterium]MBU1022127.1 GNAT family N-acetyltransferase [Candidatus Margulisiibacteriota bacterium]MBU1728643.1 GNAT family N-acetyltransferase [Candidatus Margulisiibacteriota bacterium]MBU1955094.1 GNAT family N-acetyltransferase [Candidatus Margulisiibacteriota bacterium]
MEFKLKKSNELSSLEKEQICALFERVFGKQKPLDKFKRQFESTVLGYSYHGLMVEHETIVGSYTAIPFKYRFFGKNLVFALSVDTMIDEAFRGSPFNLKKVANLVYDTLVKDKVPFVFGFPNENVYLVRKKLLQWHDIGQLNYYVLPIEIGAFKKILSWLNFGSKIVSKIVNSFSKQINLQKMIEPKPYPVEKEVDANFMRYRYDDTYKVVKGMGDSYFAYKLGEEKGVNGAYLIDVFPLQKKWLASAVKYIYENEKRIDAILYAGKLPFSAINLFKVPKSLAPKDIKMSGKILIDTLVDDRIFDITNWNVNLSNFDVR